MSHTVEYPEEDVTDANLLKYFKKKKPNAAGLKPPTPDLPLLKYSMKLPQMGYCLIFDVNKSDTSNLLKPKNAENLQTATKTFTDLGFMVNIESVKACSKIKHVLNKVANLDHSMNNCFVCIVLIHEVDFTFDQYDSRELTEEFTGDKCRTLVGKPKIFFVLVNLSNRELFHLSLLAGAKEEDVDSNLETDSGSDYQRRIAKIPVQADFLYVSFTSSAAGKQLDPIWWYMQNLCNLLLEYGHTTNILTIVTRMNSLTEQQYVGLGLEDRAFFIKPQKQFPSAISVPKTLASLPGKKQSMQVYKMEQGAVYAAGGALHSTALYPGLVDLGHDTPLHQQQVPNNVSYHSKL
ncbi:caspase-3-like [Pelodytes ibericus]